LAHLIVKTLTHSQLLARLRALKSAVPISFTAITKVDARRKGKETVSLNGKEVVVENPHDDLRKLARISGFTGNGFGGYERSVNRQAEREGKSPTFHASERSWGEMVSPALVKKGDKYYLAVHVRHSSRPLYMAKTVGGLKLVHTHSIAPFLPAPSPSFIQQLEKPIVRRDYSIESIVSVALNGERVKIVRD
jgi:hypothetical protein